MNILKKFNFIVVTSIFNMFAYSPLDCRYSHCTEVQSVQFTDEDEKHYVTAVEYEFSLVLNYKYISCKYYHC
jgi:hypothetical protein